MPSEAAAFARKLRAATRTALRCAQTLNPRHSCQGPASHFQRVLNAAASQAAHVHRPQENRLNQTVYHFHDTSALTVTNNGITPPACRVHPPGKAPALPEPPHATQPEQVPADDTLSENTLEAYATAWRNFAAHCGRRSANPLTCDTQQVAQYLQNMARQGASTATLRLHRAAIKSALDAAGRHADNPAAAFNLKKQMKALARAHGQAQKQANPLDRSILDAIRRTATIPRILPSGRTERPEAAARRGRTDIAIVSLMREALLRVSETSAVTWQDFTFLPDGTSRLFIPRSKTDQQSEGKTQYIGPQTTLDILAIRDNQAPADRVFNLTPTRITGRIQEAAAHAGVTIHLSGHSPRVGMAQDLSAEGTELPALMTAGRWKNPAMPARYTENISADRGAIAQYHRKTG